MRSWAAAAFLVALSGVLPVRAESVALARTLDVAEQAWNRASPKSYEFMFRPVAILSFVGCAGKNLHVRVIDGIAKVPVTCRSEMIHYSTIPQLFKYIRDAIASHPDRIDVAFDPALGYPTSFFIDPKLNMHDDEFQFTISHFRAIQ